MTAFEQALLELLGQIAESLKTIAEGRHTEGVCHETLTPPTWWGTIPPYGYTTSTQHSQG